MSVRRSCEWVQPARESLHHVQFVLCADRKWFAGSARTQALSEVFERYVKNKIIREAISLPAIPASVIERFPAIKESIHTLETEGFPIFCYDASLGGQFPVICVVLYCLTHKTALASHHSAHIHNLKWLLNVP